MKLSLRRRFNHPFLGELGVTLNNQLCRDGSVISDRYSSEDAALIELKNYIDSCMEEQENSVFETLRHINDVKYSKLVEFEQL